MLIKGKHINAHQRYQKNVQCIQYITVFMFDTQTFQRRTFTDKTLKGFNHSNYSSFPMQKQENGPQLQTYHGA